MNAGLGKLQISVLQLVWLRTTMSRQDRASYRASETVRDTESRYNMSTSGLLAAFCLNCVLGKRYLNTISTPFKFLQQGKNLSPNSSVGDQSAVERLFLDTKNASSGSRKDLRLKFCVKLPRIYFIVPRRMKGIDFVWMSSASMLRLRMTSPFISERFIKTHIGNPGIRRQTVCNAGTLPSYPSEGPLPTPTPPTTPSRALNCMQARILGVSWVITVFVFHLNGCVGGSFCDTGHVTVSSCEI